MRTINSKNWLLLTALGFLVIVVLSFFGDAIRTTGDVFARIYNSGEDMGHVLSDYQNRNDSCQ